MKLDFSILEEGIAFSKFHLTLGDLLVIVVLFLAIKLVLHLFRLVLTRISKARGLDVGRQYTLEKLVSYVLYTAGVIMALDQVGIDVTLLLAGSAALLVGVGLGLQHIFNDIVSGFVLLFEGAIRVDDVIEVDGLIAKVQRIDIRTSKVITREGIVLVLPNSTMTSNAVTNWSLEDKVTRFTVSVGVAYGSDVRKVEQLLLKAAKESKHVDTQRQPFVVFNDFGDSALLFDLRFWSNSLWEMDVVKSDLRFRIDELFRQEGIQIPFPQRDVHLIPPKGN